MFTSIILYHEIACLPFFKHQSRSLFCLSNIVSRSPRNFVLLQKRHVLHTQKLLDSIVLISCNIFIKCQWWIHIYALI